MFSDDILSLADKNTKHEDEEEFGDRRFISSHSSLELFCADALLSKMVLIFSAANDLLVVHICLLNYFTLECYFLYYYGLLFENRNKPVKHGIEESLTYFSNSKRFWSKNICFMLAN